MCSFSWTVNYTVSFFWNEIFEIILCFPGVQRLFFTLRSPFGKPFVVTPKGVTTNRKRYNLINTWPLLVIAILTLIALVLHVVGYWMGTWQTLQAEGFGVILFWLIYNLMTVTVALLGAIDQPERRVMDRFPLKTRCRLISGDRSCWGYSENLSEGGADLVMPAESIPWNATVTIELPDYDFAIEAKLLRITPDSQSTRVGVQFENLSIEHNRQLVEMLYTEATWWKESKHPSSIDAMLAMLQAFFQFKPILNKFN
ncbi:MAG: hypothetical protein HC895_25145 [Leptolyngbyaceae cyanobacterium SM1_3_5]|nr:hypothetical protein [Leptolyngbyaceae cyanobacterium SM1_3_5]